MPHRLSGVSSLLLLFACNQGKDPADKPTDPVFDVPAEVFLVPNLDDDDQDGVSDWQQVGAAGENDLADLALTVAAGQLTLALSGEARVWREGAVLLDAETPETTLSVDGPLTLQVESPDFVSEATLQVTWSSADHTMEASVLLRGAPLLLNHHLQTAERVFAMDGGAAYQGNKAFIEGFEDVLGDAFTGFQLSSYGFDPWIQDEIELGTASAPGGRLDVVIDSVRTQGRYLDRLPEAELAGPDVYIQTWGDGRATSQDSFGNMEVTPPITVDGVHYPFGRIYYGRWEQSQAPQDELLDLLTAQGVQDPFELDVSWLCVGHVDEFLSFIPDPASEKGFRVLVADIFLGRDLLSSMDPATDLGRYESGHGYATVGALLEDEALWAYNEDLQRDWIEPNLETLAREAGVVEADLIRIPALFEENRYCGGYALSLIPGTVNLTVAQLDPDGPTHLFLPDPFLRTDEDDPSSDPLIAYVESVLPASLELHWLNDWRLYHMAWGEVHCGSNTRRGPVADAWTLAVEE